MKHLARLGAMLAIPAFAGLGACGKDDNLHPPSLVEFPHSFPEAPRMLDTQRAPAWTSGHPIAVTAQHVFLVDRDNRELVKLDRATLKRLGAVALGAKPEQLVVGDDGAMYVSLRNGEVVRVSAAMQIEQRKKLGAMAWGVALSPDASTLYVSLPYERELRTLDVADLEEIAEPVAMLDTPRSIAASPNGFVMVVHQFSDAVKVRVDQETNLPVDTESSLALRIGNPADHIDGFRLRSLHSARALAAAVSPESGAVYVAHVTAAPGSGDDLLAADSAANGGVTNGASSDGYGSASLPGATFPIPTRPVEVTVTASDSNGGMTLPEQDFPVQDGLTGEPLTALLDQPSDVAHHPRWSLLFMTGYGSDNVLVMSTAEGDPMRSPLAIVDVGHAPRGIAFSPEGDTAYVLNEHDLTVSVIDLAPFFSLEPMADGSPVVSDTDSMAPVPMGAAREFDAMGQPIEPDPRAQSGFDPTPSSPRVRPFRLSAKSSVAYGTDPMPDAVRRGARAFTFARNPNLSHAGQFACATCHFEGTEDKLVWFITDGPRQTPALAGRLAGTAPFNWAGTKDGLQDNMVQTVSRMGGTGLTKTELSDLEQFLLYGLEAPVNPNIAPDGQLTAEQLAGKAIFEDKTTGCSTCHRPDNHFTDGFIHDVGTASQVEVVHFEFERARDPEAREPWRLDTPTLKGLFYTAPYLHDGSAATLEEVLDRTAESMGKTSHLTPEQKQQLIAYLLTL